MCNCDTGEGPSAFYSTIRKARKAHRCCECRGAIQPGDKYQYSSGVWDGRGDDFKTCLLCVKRRAVHIEAEEALQRADLDKERERIEAVRTRTVVMHGGTPATAPAPLWHYGRIESCNPVIGDLHSSINECMAEDPRYVSFYKKAWRAHERPPQPRT